jgi:hypothetical protein
MLLGEQDTSGRKNKGSEFYIMLVAEVQSIKGLESVVHFSDNFPMIPQEEEEVFRRQCKRCDVSPLRFTSQQFTSLLNS